VNHGTTSELNEKASLAARRSWAALQTQESQERISAEGLIK